MLEGISRFRVLRGLGAGTLFRQVEASFDGFDDEGDDDTALPSIIRAEIEREAKRFAAAKGYAIDWGSVERLDDEALVSGLSQAIPFDIATKQALLEAMTLADRADLLAELLHLGAGDSGETLQ